MKFKHYIDRLEGSKEFKKFKEKNPKANLCAGFFVLDFETGQNLHQIDYMLPNRKVATFLLDEGIKIKISDQAIKKKLPKIKPKAKTDLDSLKGIVEDEMKNRTVTQKIRKMIAILHIMDDKLIWNVQCILGGLGILLVHIDDSDQSILKFEKHSLMELVKPNMGSQIMPVEKSKAKKLTEKDLAKLQKMLKKAIQKKKKLKKKQVKKASPTPVPPPEPGPEVPEPEPQKVSKKKRKEKGKGKGK